MGWRNARPHPGPNAIELSSAAGPHWQALNLNPNLNLARLRFLEIKSKITIKIGKKPFRLNSMAVHPGPLPQERGEARTVCGIFMPFGVVLRHEDLRRLLRLFKSPLNSSKRTSRSSKAHDPGASLANRSINLAGLHGVAPAQRIGVGQISSGCRYVAGLNQGAEPKVNRIHIGVPIGKMSKAAVRIATAQRPVCSLLDRAADRLRFAAQLPEDEDRIETSVYIPGGVFNIPTAVGLLIPQHPRDDLPGFWRRPADQSEIMRHVEGGGNMVAQIPVFGLVAELMSAQCVVVWFGKRLAQRRIE